jgi:hypothetical protein
MHCAAFWSRDFIVRRRSFEVGFTFKWAEGVGHIGRRVTGFCRGGQTDLGVSFHITRVGTSLTLGVEIIELLRTEELDTSKDGL